MWLFVVVACGGSLAGALLLEGNLLRRVMSRAPAGLSLVGEGKLAQVYAAVTGSGPGDLVGARVFDAVQPATSACTGYVRGPWAST